MLYRGDKMEIELSEKKKERIVLATGFAHPELAQEIATEMKLPLVEQTERFFPNGEIYGRYDESVRGKDVYIIQSHARSEFEDEPTSVNDAIMQQVLLANAAFTSGAREITAVTPFLGYQRQDRKSRGRETMGASVVINQLAQYMNQIVTVDMHALSTQGIFHKGPFTHLTAQQLLRREIRQEVAGYDPSELVVVAPDAGAAKMAERHRRELGVGLLHLAKMRDANNSQKITRDEHIPEADGRVCLLFDDMVDTGGTLVSASEALKNSGAKAIFVAATHGILSNPALENLKNAPIDRLLVTDTVPTKRAEAELGDLLKVVKIAPLIAEGLYRIITHQSVSKMQDDENHR